MIKVISGTADAPDIEAISVFANKVFTDEALTCDIQYEDLDTAEKVVYDEGMSIISTDFYCSVININAEMQMNRMTSNVLADNESEVDYATLSVGDKAKLDAFLQLIIDKCW